MKNGFSDDIKNIARISKALSYPARVYILKKSKLVKSKNASAGFLYDGEKLPESFEC